MDYSTMKSKLMYNCYKSEQDFTKDIHLVYGNCMKYNGLESVYGMLAEKLKHEYDNELMKEFAFFDDWFLIKNKFKSIIWITEIKNNFNDFFRKFTSTTFLINIK